MSLGDKYWENKSNKSLCIERIVSMSKSLKLRHYIMVTGGVRDGTETASRRRCSKVLRKIDIHLHDGLDVASSCHKAGI